MTELERNFTLGSKISYYEQLLVSQERKLKSVTSPGASAVIMRNVMSLRIILKELRAQRAEVEGKSDEHPL